MLAELFCGGKETRETLLILRGGAALQAAGLGSVPIQPPVPPGVFGVFGVKGDSAEAVVRGVPCTGGLKSCVGTFQSFSMPTEVIIPPSRLVTFRSQSTPR